jgi:hypothetical protein
MTPSGSDNASLRAAVRSSSTPSEGRALPKSPRKDHDFGYAKGNFMIELTSRLI